MSSPPLNPWWRSSLNPAATHAQRRVRGKIGRHEGGEKHVVGDDFRSGMSVEDSNILAKSSTGGGGDLPVMAACVRSDERIVQRRRLMLNSGCVGGGRNDSGDTSDKNIGDDDDTEEELVRLASSDWALQRGALQAGDALPPLLRQPSLAAGIL
ncbi:hypothetical protein E2562_012899 [Oryza meyeriana var. granulata]|uniref:Uncharacterized protein n=1 Tax=Oryza meyeriana var. granulata TaxID=110450 RepID=A0A6G1CFV6_9ORYZ|nr:hypothetical protein E2562_012899 [Oryza meyeriana var. granulata]